MTYKRQIESYSGSIKVQSKAVLTINHLSITLHTQPKPIYPLDDMQLTIPAGKTYALLGESGCGKSMTALAIMRLLPPIAHYDPQSEIILEQTSLLQLSEAHMRQVRGGRISMIFQEPMTSLNPVLPIGQQIAESLRLHSDLSARARAVRVVELLDTVGIAFAERRAKEYPHQLSGGMKQRVMIAMALASDPQLLIADEPTTALDVTTQAQILELLAHLQQERGMAMLLITHDLAVAKQMADEVGVMYAGHIVEQAPAQQFFAYPAHPYSQLLFTALPTLAKRQQTLSLITGQVPALTERTQACRFADRCPYVWDLCRQVPPPWYRVRGDGTAQVRCYLYAPEQSARKPLAEATLPSLARRSESMEILSIDKLAVHFPIHKGLFRRRVGEVRALEEVSLQLQQGKTLAIVGESGSGKSTLARAIVNLIAPTAGKVWYKQQDITHPTTARRISTSREIQLIFQDPFSSLNPRMLVNDIIQEGLLAHHRKLNNQQRDARVISLLDQVGLPTQSANRYPHEFSGGQRQRIAIARALAVGPRLLICDEPTSALDVSVQAQILNLLRQLQAENDLSYLFISHNLAVVAYLADNIAVMKNGRIVEQGSAEQVLQSPQHAYTKQLLAAVPNLDSCL